MNKTPLFYKNEIVMYSDGKEEKIPCLVIEAFYYKRSIAGYNERYIIQSLDPKKQFIVGANFCAGEYLEKTNMVYQEIDTIRIFQELSN